MCRQLAVSLVVALTACGGLIGNGRRATEARTVPAFSALRVSDALHVVATTGERAVTITADDNLLPLVRATVEGDTLVLDVAEVAWSPSRIEVAVSNERFEGVAASGASTVTMPSTTSDTFTLEADGASTVSVSALSAAKTTLTIDGASTVAVTGVTPALTVRASGASTAKLTSLSAARADVTIDGASTVRLSVSEQVSGLIDGASTLELSGAPAQVSVERRGAPTVRNAR